MEEHLAVSPKHIVIIMDGNGRWAKAREQRRLKGHQAGAMVAKKIITHASERGIECLSLFAFSSENWMRPKQEVLFLMDLLLSMLTRETKSLHKKNIKIVFTGDLKALSPKIQAAISKSENLTADNTGMVLNVVFNYGGRWDVLQATKKIALKVKDGSLQPNEINESMFSSYLCLAELPEPDLLIRTSGEYRISNFFLWQLAYAELYFCEAYWPDFNELAFDTALNWYAKRERRFGKISEQLPNKEIENNA